MPKLIFIRVNASYLSGIGHLSRTHSLAVSLRKHQIESYFVLDNENSIYHRFLNEFKCIFLYHGNEDFIDEKSDAIRFIEAIESFKIDGIIVDDYRLSIDWEKSVLGLNCPLIVLDDRDATAHQCNMIVDAKWTRDSTIYRYKNKVPEDCQRLLGPKYILLSNSYAKPKELLNRNLPFNNTHNLMLNFGGGGDLDIVADLLTRLLKKAPKDINFCVQTVIGPFASNKNVILSIAAKDERVKTIINANSLHDHLKSTDIYIGASGGTLYEALSMNIPALTFSISENQYNQLDHLEDFGHYFHLNNFSQELFNEFSKLVWLMISNINRMQQLYAKERIIYIDGYGSKRVAKKIDALLKKEQSSSKLPDLLFKSSVIQNTENQISNYIVESIDDTYVNKYLDARNLTSNLRNMTEVDKVKRLNHYIWWFKNDRSSFVLKKDNEPLLYIWHQLKIVNGIQVLIGGWFPCNESCSSFDIIYALNWQLVKTDKQFPFIPWVAVIKKTNNFVKLLNKRFSFKLISEDDVLFSITSECFPHATITDFDYFYRK